MAPEEGAKMYKAELCERKASLGVGAGERQGDHFPLLVTRCGIPLVNGECWETLQNGVGPENLFSKGGSILEKTHRYTLCIVHRMGEKREESEEGVACHFLHLERHIRKGRGGTKRGLPRTPN